MKWVVIGFAIGTAFVLLLDGCSQSSYTEGSFNTLTIKIVADDDLTVKQQRSQP